jgi:hypothetical protein
MQITKKKLEQILKEEITRMGAEIRRRQLKAVKNYIKANPNPSMKALRRVGPKLSDEELERAKRQEQGRGGTLEEVNQTVSEVFGFGYLEYIVNAAKDSVKEHNRAEGSNSVTLKNEKRGSDLELLFKIRRSDDFYCQVVLVPDEGGIGIQIACVFKQSVDKMIEKQFFKNLQDSLPDNLELEAAPGGGAMITGFQKLDRAVQKNIAQALRGPFSYVLSKLQESYDEISGGAQRRSVRKSFEEAKGKKVSGPFVVTKRPDKIKGVTHWAIVHEPSNLYIPSTMYKMKAGPVKALAKELNTNFGDLRSAKLEKEDVEAIKDFILNSKFRDPAV